MSPTLARLDSADGALMNSIVFRNINLASLIEQDVSRLGLRKTRHPIPIPRIHERLMASKIQKVLVSGSPIQVFDLVVLTIAVLVAALSSLGRFTDEGDQDKTMRLATPSLAVMNQRYLQSTVISDLLFQNTTEDPACLAGSDRCDPRLGSKSPMVGDLKSIRTTGQSNPDFLSYFHAAF